MIHQWAMQQQCTKKADPNLVRRISKIASLLRHTWHTSPLQEWSLITGRGGGYKMGGGGVSSVFYTYKNGGGEQTKF